jgi:hypothetical protein
MNRKLMRVLLVALGVFGVLWFLCVNRCVGVQECGNCGYRADYVDYRVCGITVARRTYTQGTPFLARIAEDLGAPCEHPAWRDILLRRYWGLVLCFKWDHAGMQMVGDSKYRYTKRFQEAVRQLAKDRPGLAEEFRDRVIYAHDREFWEEVLELLRPHLGPEELNPTGQ